MYFQTNEASEFLVSRWMGIVENRKKEEFFLIYIFRLFYNIFYNMYDIKQLKADAKMLIYLKKICKNNIKTKFTIASQPYLKA